MRSRRRRVRRGKRNTSLASKLVQSMNSASYVRPGVLGDGYTTHVFNRSGAHHTGPMINNAMIADPRRYLIQGSGFNLGRTIKRIGKKTKRAFRPIRKVVRPFARGYGKLQNLNAEAISMVPGIGALAPQLRAQAKYLNKI